MAAFDQGPLAKYNSLTDKHLAGYFSNDRMKRHLVRSGLITKNGEVVPDATYRVKIARREHRRRVRDMIAQAIIHKALEMERSRQIDIRRKIEDIAKMELVRRVKTDRNRVGDEDCLSYFQPGNMEVKRGSKKSKSPRPESDDDRKLPLTEEEESRKRLRRLLPKEEIETKHLTQLDSMTLGEYAKILQREDRKRIDKLPYLGMGKQTSRAVSAPQKKKSKKKKKTDAFDDVGDEDKDATLASSRSSQAKPNAPVKLSIIFQSTTNRSHLVTVEQQPSGGNTLILYRNYLVNNDVFEIVSKRHIGFPFSLTFYIDNVKDSRISTCCEYKHKVGSKIGGPNGHFTLFQVENVNPCYRCKTELDLSRDQKNKNNEKTKSTENESSRTISVKSSHADEYESENEFESESEGESKDNENEPGENKEDEDSGEEIEVREITEKDIKIVKANRNNNAIRNESEEYDTDFSDNDKDVRVKETNNSDSAVIRVEKIPTAQTSDENFQNNSSSFSDDNQNESTERNEDYFTDEDKVNAALLTPRPVAVAIKSSDESQEDGSKESESSESDSSQHISLESDEKDVKINVINESKPVVNDHDEGIDNSRLSKTKPVTVIPAIDEEVKPKTSEKKVHVIAAADIQGKESQQPSEIVRTEPLVNVDRKDQTLDVKLSDKTSEQKPVIIVHDKENAKMEIRQPKITPETNPVIKIHGKEPDVDIRTSNEKLKTTNSEIIVHSKEGNGLERNENVEESRPFIIVHREDVKSPATKGVGSKPLIVFHDNENPSGNIKPVAVISTEPVETKPVDLNSEVVVNRGSVEIYKEPAVEGNLDVKDDFIKEDMNRSISIELTVNSGQKEKEHTTLDNENSGHSQRSSSSSDDDTESSKPYLSAQVDKLPPTAGKLGIEEATIDEKNESFEVESAVNDGREEEKELTLDKEKDVRSKIVRNRQYSSSDDAESSILSNDVSSSSLTESAEMYPNTKNVGLSAQTLTEEDKKELKINLTNVESKNQNDTDNESSDSDNESPRGKASVSVDANEGGSLKVENSQLDKDLVNGEFQNNLNKELDPVVSKIDDSNKPTDNISQSVDTHYNDNIEASGSSPNENDASVSDSNNGSEQNDKSFGSSAEMSEDSGIDIFISDEEMTFKKARDIFQKIENKFVKSLTIQNTELQTYVFDYITNQLSFHRELKMITLSKCEMELALLNVLAKKLEKWPNLEYLALSNNHFNDYSLQPLMFAIKVLYHDNGNVSGKRQTLKVLDLSYCYIQTNDYDELIDVIDSNTNVETVILSGNATSHVQFRKLGDALQKNKNTKSVVMKDCRITNMMWDEIAGRDSVDMGRIVI